MSKIDNTLSCPVGPAKLAELSWTLVASRVSKKVHHPANNDPPFQDDSVFFFELGESTLKQRRNNYKWLCIHVPIYIKTIFQKYIYTYNSPIYLPQNTRKSTLPAYPASLQRFGLAFSHLGLETQIVDMGDPMTDPWGWYRLPTFG